MESIVKSMEEEVRSIQKELELVHAERRAQRRLSSTATVTKSMVISEKAACPNQCTEGVDRMSTLECELSTLKEKYRKLQQDYNAKVEEVSMIHVEYDAAKRDIASFKEKTNEAEERAEKLLKMLKIVENEKNKVVDSKDYMMEMEQKLQFAKQKYRDSVEETEEIRTNFQDLAFQFEEYRNKYLDAQQMVEELRRQMDIKDMESNRIGEQVSEEIKRVKDHFQEKLQELTPLPDMLKATQMKLQETQQLKKIAENNIEILKKEINDMNDKHQAVIEELDEYKQNLSYYDAEKIQLKNNLESCGKKIEEIKNENSKLRDSLAQFEELVEMHKRRYDEKCHESSQLSSQLETLREESARQVARTKDRCDSVRKGLLNQISELEKELAQSRGAVRTAQKDRDEIRQKMQAQISSLNENFEQAQLRIRSLQSHVNYLRNSYTNLFNRDQRHIPIIIEDSI